MPLSGDQRALLKLVAERGQSYADIASLLGTDEAVVRSRARRALAAAAGTDLDRSANITDFLLGQADPIARADAVRHLSRNPEDRDRAEQALLALEAIAPRAQPPDLPEARESAPRRTAPAAKRQREASRLQTRLDAPQRRLIALLGGLALVIVIAVIAIASGGGDDTDSADAIDPDFVRVELEPAAGVNGSGTAVIGQTDDDQPFIELDLEGLSQLRGNSNYVLWMLTDNRRGIPVAPIEIEDGEFHDRMPLLSPADLVAAFSRSIAVAVMSSSELQQSLQGLLRDFSDQQDEEAQLPVTRYRARTILQGEIPTLAELAEEAEDANGEADGDQENGQSGTSPGEDG